MAEDVTSKTQLPSLFQHLNYESSTFKAHLTSETRIDRWDFALEDASWPAQEMFLTELGCNNRLRCLMEKGGVVNSHHRRRQFLPLPAPPTAGTPSLILLLHSWRSALE